MGKSNVITEIKALGWSAIKLNQKNYRGGIVVYKNDNRENVPVMFYVDDCFVIEDKDGLYKVEDLKDFFITHTNVNMNYLERIVGLQVLSYIDSQGVVHNEEQLDRLGINSDYVREDIARRLKSVYKLGEVVNVDMGFN